MTHEIDEVPPRRRLTAGEVDLQHAERVRLVEHAPPGRGVELDARPLQLDRVGAVGALQRAAMGELGEERDRRWNRNVLIGDHGTLLPVVPLRTPQAEASGVSRDVRPRLSRRPGPKPYSSAGK